MPKKTRKHKNLEFYETLTPSLPYQRHPLATMPALSTPLWVYPAWVMGSIVLGVLLGLAIKDFEQTKTVVVGPGIIANINNPSTSLVANSLELAKTTNRIPQGNTESLQGSTPTLQGLAVTTTYQNSFSAYGQQGSVGTAAARR